MSQIFRVKSSKLCFLLIRRYTRNSPNYYEILNIPRNATQKEIKEAFIILSKQSHPDKTGKRSHAEFVKISEAYNVLGKKSSRQEYDFRLQNKMHPRYYDYNPRNRNHYESYYYTHHRRREADKDYYKTNSGDAEDEEEAAMGRIRTNLFLTFIIAGTIIFSSAFLSRLHYEAVRRKQEINSMQYNLLRHRINSQTKKENEEHILNKLKNIKSDSV